MSTYSNTTDVSVRRAYVQAKQRAEGLRRERERREAGEPSLHDLRIELGQAKAA